MSQHNNVVALPVIKTSIRSRIEGDAAARRMNECAAGTLKMSAQQFKANEVILKKTCPDLSAVILADPDGNALPVNFTINL
jgi:hypothetical protein